MGEETEAQRQLLWLSSVFLNIIPGPSTLFVSCTSRGSLSGLFAIHTHCLTQRQARTKKMLNA